MKPLKTETFADEVRFNFFNNMDTKESVKRDNVKMIA